MHGSRIDFEEGRIFKFNIDGRLATLVWRCWYGMAWHSKAWGLGTFLFFNEAILHSISLQINAKKRKQTIIA